MGQRWFESDAQYLRRVEREAAEVTVKRGSGEHPRQSLLESDGQYARRVRREAAEYTVGGGSGSGPGFEGVQLWHIALAILAIIVGVSIIYRDVSARLQHYVFKHDPCRPMYTQISSPGYIPFTVRQCETASIRMRGDANAMKLSVSRAKVVSWYGKLDAPLELRLAGKSLIDYGLYAGAPTQEGGNIKEIKIMSIRRQDDNKSYVISTERSALQHVRPIYVAFTAQTWNAADSELQLPKSNWPESERTRD